METVKLKISKDKLQLLVDSDAITFDDIELVSTDEDDYDYSSNELWQLQRAKSNKEYKKLKQIEFDIRKNN